MRAINVFIIMAIILCVSVCYADTQIRSEVDKTVVGLKDTITYKLIITSSEKKLPQPKIAQFKGFKVISRANSSTVSFIKGDIKTILVFAFILLPEATGRFTIDESSVKVAGKELSSEKFEITVLENPEEAGQSGSDKIHDKKEGVWEPQDQGPIDIGSPQAEKYNI